MKKSTPKKKGVAEGRKPGDIGNPSFSAFKRDQHEQEAQHERELERQRIEHERGPWFIILRGKPVSTGGQPKEFNHLKGAKAYFRAMMDRNPKFAEKIRTEYTAAADKNTVVYYSKTLPIESQSADNQPNVKEEIITSPNFGGLSQQVNTKTGNTTLNYQAGPMQSQQTKDASGKVISNKTSLDLGIGVLGMGQEKGITTKSWKTNAPADENPITSKDLYTLGDKGKEATYDRAMNYVQQQKQPTREGRQDRETRDLFAPTVKDPRVDRQLLKPTVAPPSGPTTKQPGPVIKTPPVDRRLLDPRLPPDTATPKTSPVIKDPGSMSGPVMVFLSMKDSNYRNQFKSYRFPSQAAAERWANVNNAVIHNIKPEV